jgi:hypothetical protein
MVERPAIITEDEGVAARRPLAAESAAESAAMAKKPGFSLQSRQRGDKGGRRHVGAAKWNTAMRRRGRTVVAHGGRFGGNGVEAERPVGLGLERPRSLVVKRFGRVGLRPLDAGQTALLTQAGPV